MQFCGNVFLFRNFWVILTPLGISMGEEGPQTLSPSPSSLGCSIFLPSSSNSKWKVSPTLQFPGRERGKRGDGAKGEPDEAFFSHTVFSHPLPPSRLPASFHAQEEIFKRGPGKRRGGKIDGRGGEMCGYTVYIRRPLRGKEVHCMDGGRIRPFGRDRGSEGGRILSGEQRNLPLNFSLNLA